MPDPAQAVYEAATVLLQRLQPWASQPPPVRDACAALTLKLAQVPESTQADQRGQS